MKAFKEKHKSDERMDWWLMVQYTDKKADIKWIPNQILFEMNTDGHQRSVSTPLLKFRINVFFLSLSLSLTVLVYRFRSDS